VVNMAKWDIGRRAPRVRERAWLTNGHFRTSSNSARYPGAVPCARLHVRQLMWEWGLVGLSENVEILVSELVTNAIHASQSLERAFPVGLSLLSDKSRVLILVWDANPRPPVRMDVNEEAETGRGLLLVETLSDQWGVIRHARERREKHLGRVCRGGTVKGDPARSTTVARAGLAHHH
jgi:anti-sigma regulatory factor (Ser/Thr protein kinase)